MYVLYAYACMHVCTMYVCMCVLLLVCMTSNKFCMCVRLHVCIYVYLCGYMYVFVYVFVCVHTREHHYSDETEMEHAPDLYVDGVSREDIDEVSDNEDGD